MILVDVKIIVDGGEGEAHRLLSAPLTLSVLVSFETDEEPNRVKSGERPFNPALYLKYEVFFKISKRI